ncbi:hypothetical protein D6C85_10439 [Aureobasidium pullulans]|uniref:NADP-dependent oxidoreductase domain-containing protein n=1 Tax=Aureobasidium pullulans TaxID=5580 RepID=A0A4S9VXR7_AURPU|nr:hypothetical protein D6C85_10439 [Aureobasidium pullulans]
MTGFSNLDDDCLMPSMIYGTAWKGESTAELTKTAIRCGFTGVDTAPDLKNYREDLVGDAIRECFNNGDVVRKQLYVSTPTIQTKFTPSEGVQSIHLPYDKESPLAEQVKQSIKNSLHHLKEDHGPRTVPGHAYIDCLILHFPLQTASATFEVWAAMETFVPQEVRRLGLSNVSVQVLRRIYETVSIKPFVVQNRWCAQTGYDAALRTFCLEKGIIYQAYGILTKSPELLLCEPVLQVVRLAGVSKAAALYFLVKSLGNVSILDGTCDREHMVSDQIELEHLRHWSISSGNQGWDPLLKCFEDIVNESAI